MLAQRCQLIGVDPLHFLGIDITVIDTDTGEVDGVFEVGDEMVSGVRMFLDTIDAAREPDSIVATERRAFHKDNEDFGGTIDSEVWTPSTDALTITDLKYGAGVGVEVEGNEQLLSYLAISLSHYDVWPVNLTVRIVQPRYDHPEGPVRSWSPTHDEVRDFQALVMDLIDPNTETDKSLVVGDHCRWCDCKRNCPAIAAATNDLAAAEFDKSNRDVVYSDGDTKVAFELTPERIEQILEKKTAVTAFFKELETWRHERMAAGEKFPGRKLIHDFGNREWKLSPDEMLVKLRSREFKKGDTFTTQIKSPAQMEAVPGMDKAWVNSLCVRPLRGTKVVAASHKSPAVDPNEDAATEFAKETFDA